MGVDFLDLTFRVEKEFRIRFTRDENQQWVQSLLDARPVRDISVQEFVDFVEKSVLEKNPLENVDVFRRVQRHISECLFVPLEKVVPDAWMVQDLGME